MWKQFLISKEVQNRNQNPIKQSCLARCQMSRSTFCVVWARMHLFRGNKVENHSEMAMAFEIWKCQHVVSAYLEGHGMVPECLHHFAYNDANAQR